MAGFNKGALGSPWSREHYGPTGADPGDAENGNEYGPRVGPGKFAKRVTAEVSRNANVANNKDSDD